MCEGVSYECTRAFTERLQLPLYRARVWWDYFEAPCRRSLRKSIANPLPKEHQMHGTGRGIGQFMAAGYFTFDRLSAREPMVVQGLVGNRS